ncbi:AAA family ATPase [Bacteroides finegoldii]|nr:AAA family ATPase [Bacteroides finegoldii]
MQKSVAKVLTGQRCVGKSFFLYQLIEEILGEEPDANIIYINLEDFAFSSLQTAEDLHSYIISHSKEKAKNYIFIDEVLTFS